VHDVVWWILSNEIGKTPAVLALSAPEVEGPRLSGTRLSVREVSRSIVIARAKAQDERGRFRLEVT
jgi:hypothetical protein